ncbi:hypothetical protein [Cochleicola gelatinilyticus]|uniref:Anti-sigma factor n=1 Tax=Cochleicola gelatinilyticus TaxID=1763537 RepID=A0A167H2T4_9FLAO|nr:hypothetical protein [Cochleicola gelatinilyticus]OAB78156.1 hypothetical protein ULVI_11785 [Cochleicola gelatinilyticus]
MKKDAIDELFKNLEGSFDIHETANGHQKRFLTKLQNKTTKEEPKNKTWWKPLSIAASIAVLLAVSSLFLKTTPTYAELASVSPEMKETQSFFTSTISEELQTLKSFNTTETKELVDDALYQLSILEEEYESLKIDLTESGNDKRVIYAMINNFQNRIELLQQVIETIEEIKTLKNYKDETTL